MLDDLLGRTVLKERIAALEEERDHLQAELEAERERRADAQTARQEAERTLNRLEDRIDQLEGDLARQDAAEAEAVEARHEEDLRGERLAAVLDRLASLESDPEGILTAFVRDGHDLPGAVRDAFGDRAALVASAAPCLAVTDDAALVGACLSTPVAPEPFAAWDDAVQMDRQWFEPTGTYTLALVRSDLFAMGTYDGDDRDAFHGFTADLKSQHSKGGFSQGRFERLRDEQIDDHVERCLAALAEREADPVYVVGERSVLAEFSEVADVTAPVDATGEPEAALYDAFRSFWTVKLRSI
jgi:peptide subunit release factor 1 (eRF1)